MIQVMKCQYSGSSLHTILLYGQYIILSSVVCNTILLLSLILIPLLLQGYGRDMVKMEEEDRHMNVNVSSSSSGQGTKTVILQIPKVKSPSTWLFGTLGNVDFVYRTSSKGGPEDGRVVKRRERRGGDACVVNIQFGFGNFTSLFLHNV